MYAMGNVVSVKSRDKTGTMSKSKNVLYDDLFSLGQKLHRQFLRTFEADEGICFGIMWHGKPYLHIHIVE